jgi:hypothetical protein
MSHVCPTAPREGCRCLSPLATEKLCGMGVGTASPVIQEGFLMFSTGLFWGVDNHLVNTCSAPASVPGLGMQCEVNSRPRCRPTAGSSLSAGNTTGRELSRTGGTALGSRKQTKMVSGRGRSRPGAQKELGRALQAEGTAWAAWEGGGELDRGQVTEQGT